MTTPGSGSFNFGTNLPEVVAQIQQGMGQLEAALGRPLKMTQGEDPFARIGQSLTSAVERADAQIKQVEQRVADLHRTSSATGVNPTALAGLAGQDTATAAEQVKRIIKAEYETAGREAQAVFANLPSELRSLSTAMQAGVEQQMRLAGEALNELGKGSVSRLTSLYAADPKTAQYIPTAVSASASAPSGEEATRAVRQQAAQTDRDTAAQAQASREHTNAEQDLTQHLRKRLAELEAVRIPSNPISRAAGGEQGRLDYKPQMGRLAEQLGVGQPVQIDFDQRGNASPNLEQAQAQTRANLVQARDQQLAQLRAQLRDQQLAQLQAAVAEAYSPAASPPPAAAAPPPPPPPIKPPPPPAAGAPDPDDPVQKAIQEAERERLAASEASARAAQAQAKGQQEETDSSTAAVKENKNRAALLRRQNEIVDRETKGRNTYISENISYNNENDRLYYRGAARVIDERKNPLLAADSRNALGRIQAGEIQERFADPNSRVSSQQLDEQYQQLLRALLEETELTRNNGQEVNYARLDTAFTALAEQLNLQAARVAKENGTGVRAGVGATAVTPGGARPDLSGTTEIILNSGRRLEAGTLAYTNAVASATSAWDTIDRAAKEQTRQLERDTRLQQVAQAQQAGDLQKGAGQYVLTPGGARPDAAISNVITRAGDEVARASAVHTEAVLAAAKAYDNEAREVDRAAALARVHQAQLNGEVQKGGGSYVLTPGGARPDLASSTVVSRAGDEAARDSVTHHEAVQAAIKAYDAEARAVQRAAQAANRQSSDRTLAGSFVGGLTAGRSNEQGFDVNALARRAGTVASVSLLYRTMGLLQGVIGDVQKQYFDFIDSQTAFNASMGEGNEATQSYLSTLSQFSREVGSNVGEALDVAARGVAAFSDKTKDSIEVQRANGAALEKTASQLSLLSGKGLQDQAGDVIAIANSFGTTISQLDGISDAVVNAARNTGRPIGDISQGLANISTTANAAGYDTNQAANLIALVMSKTDQAGATAASRLTRIFAMIGGTQGQNAIAQVNELVSPSNQVDVKLPIADQVRQLAGAYQELGASGNTAAQARLRESLGGTANIRELLPLLTNQDELQRYNAASSENAGAAASTYQKRLGDITGTVKTLTGTYHALMVDFANTGIFDPLIIALKALSPVLQTVDRLLETFNGVLGGADSKTAAITFSVLELVAAYRLLATLSRNGIRVPVPALLRFNTLAGGGGFGGGGTAGQPLPTITQYRDTDKNPLASTHLLRDNGGVATPQIVALQKAEQEYEASLRRLDTVTKTQAEVVANAAEERAAAEQAQIAAIEGTAAERAAAVAAANAKYASAVETRNGAVGAAEAEARTARGAVVAGKGRAESSQASLAPAIGREQARLDRAGAATQAVREKGLSETTRLQDQENALRARALRQEEATGQSQAKLNARADRLAQERIERQRVFDKDLQAAQANELRVRAEASARIAGLQSGAINPRGLLGRTGGAVMGGLQSLPLIGAGITGASLIGGALGGALLTQMFVSQANSIRALADTARKESGKQVEQGSTTEATVANVKAQNEAVRSASVAARASDNGLFSGLVDKLTGDNANRSSDQALDQSRNLSRLADALQAEAKSTDLAIQAAKNPNDLAAQIDLSNADAFSTSITKVDKAAKTAQGEVDALNTALGNLAASSNNAAGKPPGLSAAKSVDFAALLGSNVQTNLNELLTSYSAQNNTNGSLGSLGKDVIEGLSRGKLFGNRGGRQSDHYNPYGFGKNDNEDTANVLRNGMNNGAFGRISSMITEQVGAVAQEQGGKLQGDKGTRDRIKKMIVDIVVSQLPSFNELPKDIRDKILAELGTNANTTFGAVDPNAAKAPVDPATARDKAIADAQARDATSQGDVASAQRRLDTALANGDSKGIAAAEANLNDKARAGVEAHNQAVVDVANANAAYDSAQNKASVDAANEAIANGITVAQAAGKAASSARQLGVSIDPATGVETPLDPKRADINEGGDLAGARAQLASAQTTRTNALAINKNADTKDIDEAIREAKIAVANGVMAMNDSLLQLTLSAMSPFDKTGQLTAQVTAVTDRLKTDTDPEKKRADQIALNQFQAQQADDKTKTADAKGTAEAAGMGSLTEAQAARDNAKRDMDAITATGVKSGQDYENALAAYAKSLQSVTQAEEGAATAARQLAIDLTDPVQMAKDALTEALKKQTDDAGMDQGTKDADELAVRRARVGQESAEQSQWLTDLQNSEKLGQISHSSYIDQIKTRRAQLAAELASMKETDTGYRQIKDQVTNLDEILHESATSMQGAFNVGDVKLPTLYQVRRFITDRVGQLTAPIRSAANGLNAVLTNTSSPIADLQNQVDTLQTSNAVSALASLQSAIDALAGGAPITTVPSTSSTSVAGTGSLGLTGDVLAKLAGPSIPTQPAGSHSYELAKAELGLTQAQYALRQAQGASAGALSPAAAGVNAPAASSAASSTVTINISGGDLQQVRAVMSQYLGPQAFATSTSSIRKV